MTTTQIGKMWNALSVDERESLIEKKSDLRFARLRFEDFAPLGRLLVVKWLGYSPKGGW